MSTITPEQERVLFLLWEQSRPDIQRNPVAPADSLWHEQRKALFSMNTGLEEVFSFLYGGKSSFGEFLEWLEQNRLRTLSQAQPDKEYAADTLGKAELDLWKENGYVIIREAVSKTVYEDVADAIWEFLGASADDPESWYRPHPAKSGMMVQLNYHPAFDAVRSSPKIRRAYEQLYGTRDIFPTIDKVSFNPPETTHYHFKGSPLHWDVDLTFPIPEAFQGMLYLNDVSSDGGAFSCVPGFHHRVDEWLRTLPPGTIAQDYAAATLKPVAVAANAGDFIIWHQALPHCATPNKSNKPRLAQYLTYLPVNDAGLKDQ